MRDRIKNIKRVLAGNGVSQNNLAERFERSDYTISNWCVNKAQPHLKDLRRIAEILDVDICELLEPTKSRN